MRYLYHATPFNNLGSILECGLNPGNDGLVYVCEKPEDAIKFLYIRGFKELLVCKIKILKKDEKFIVETFDHSERFFKCRAFGYRGHISTDKIVDYIKYEW